MSPSTSSDGAAGSAYRWRAFVIDDAEHTLRQLKHGALPRCPRCETTLHPRVDSRRAGELVLDAVGYDLDCAQCRRFVCVAIHTDRSLRFLRMRRLAAAVAAVGKKRLPRRTRRSSLTV